MKDRTNWIETGDKTGTDRALEVPPPMKRQEATTMHKLEMTQAAAMMAALDVARRYAAASGTVLIQGETGTGKTELAHFIHAHSARAESEMLELSCAALPESLLESELFGHEKGAFTGAASAKKGAFELAHGSTLFLDEVGELSLAAQQRLLCVLQDGRVRRVGGARVTAVDVRVIAATNKDLAAEVKAGRFREDLYYRLAQLDLHMPPLRDRREDIPLMLQAIPDLPSDAAAAMADSSHGWPGNIRELMNTARKAKVLGWGADEVRAHLGDAANTDRTEESPPQRLSTRDATARVVELAARPQGVGRGEVAEALGYGVTHASRLLSRLARAGTLERSDWGRYVSARCAHGALIQWKNASLGSKGGDQ